MSVPWGAIALAGVLVLWGCCGTASWFVALLGARVGFVALALAFAAGVGGGALVPALGYTDVAGFWVSLLTAFGLGAFVSAGAAQQAHQRPKEEVKADR